MALIDSEYLDQRLASRIYALEEDAAKGTAAVYGTDVQSVVDFNKDLESILQEEFGENPFISISTEEIQPKRQALFEALMLGHDDDIRRSFLAYVHGLRIVKEQRWERFRKIVSTFSLVKIERWTLLCELLELEYCSSQAFETAKVSPYAAGCADAIDRLNQEFLELIKSQGNDFFDLVTQKLEALYRLDCKSDLTESGVAWLKPREFIESFGEGRYGGYTDLLISAVLQALVSQ